jgi:hypothetical protein
MVQCRPATKGGFPAKTFAIKQLLQAGLPGARTPSGELMSQIRKSVCRRRFARLDGSGQIVHWVRADPSACCYFYYVSWIRENRSKSV